jgi:Kef-type K+ transport system membrane component KefB
LITDPLFALGILVAAAAGLAFCGDWLRLPRVTSYLLAGVIVGPAILDLLDHEVLHHLEPLADLAMALVLFNLGSHFSFQWLYKIRAQIGPLAIGDLLLTSSCVSIGLFALGMGVFPALMLGCLAMATAPATTVLVLKELRSEGPITESAQALVAINNLATILTFELLMLAMVTFAAAGSADIFGQIQSILWTFVGSAFVGAAFGVALSFSAGLLSTMNWIVVLMAVSMVGLGVCAATPMSFMLMFLVMGFVFANTSQDNQQDLAESHKITALLCVAFFAIHGAELRLDQFMLLGIFGTAYILLRILGKYLGICTAARWSTASREMRDWLGIAMLSQAGVALALSADAVSRDRAMFEPVQTVILGSVIVFEILGPLLIRAAVVNSGEVPIAHVARHSSLSLADQFRGMWWKLKSSLGTDPLPAVDALDMTVGALARTRVIGIRQNARFDEIIAHIENSHDNTFPVVNSNNQVVGLIRYPMLSESLFDPKIAELVRAEDLATDVEKVVFADEPAWEAFEYFQSSSDDCIPIVSRDKSRQMQGVIRRADLRTVLIRKRKKGSSGH